MAKPRITKKDTVLLADIVQATVNESFVYASEESTEKLVALGYVDLNVTLVNDDNEIGTRATPLGISWIEDKEGVVEKTNEPEEEVESKEEPEEPEEPALSTEIDYDIPTPEVRRTLKKVDVPFGGMDIGGSFHVACSDEMPNPKKTLASRVSNATAKYKKEGVVTRKFVIRKAEENDPKGPGARIFRVS